MTASLNKTPHRVLSAFFTIFGRCPAPMKFLSLLAIVSKLSLRPTMGRVTLSEDAVARE
jgi:hypothetical protein